MCNCHALDALIERLDKLARRAAALLRVHGNHANARKYVLATTNTQDIIQMNVEDKVRGDLINDLTIPSAKK